MTNNTMVKKVKIHAPIAVRTISPPIYGDIETSMSPANILKCLISRATVYEILSDGSLLKLNNTNYNTENKPKVKRVVNNKLEKDISHSAVKDEPHVKTMTLGDKVSLDEKARMAITESIPEALNNIKNAIDKELKVEVPVSDVKVPQPPEMDEHPFFTPANKEVVEDKDAEKKEEDDPELAEIAAEIAKLEAEETNKD